MRPPSHLAQSRAQRIGTRKRHQLFGSHCLIPLVRWKRDRYNYTIQHCGENPGRNTGLRLNGLFPGKRSSATETQLSSRESIPSKTVVVVKVGVSPLLRCESVASAFNWFFREDAREHFCRWPVQSAHWITRVQGVTVNPRGPGQLISIAGGDKRRASIESERQREVVDTVNPPVMTRGTFP